VDSASYDSNGTIVIVGAWSRPWMGTRVTMMLWRSESAVFKTLVWRAIAALTLCAMAGPAMAQSTPPQQFDLVCTLGGGQWSWHLHLDLANGGWCDEDSQPCTAPKALIVQPNKIWFRQGDTDQTPLGLEILSEYVDRTTGVIHIERSYGGQDQPARIGVCQVAPFMSTTPKQF
jgi:hypothetical protein